MKYLKCDKCGGYYELQEGESINDFDGCECGGNFVEISDLENSQSNKKRISNADISKRLAAKRKGLTISEYEAERKGLTVSEYEAKFCNNCGTKNLEDAKFCVKCGSRVGANICPKCEIENPRDAQFCKECGTNLRNRSQSVESPKENIIKKGLSAGEAIVIILFSPLAGFIGFLVWHDSKPQKSQDSCIIAIVVGFILLLLYIGFFLAEGYYY